MKSLLVTNLTYSWVTHQARWHYGDTESVRHLGLEHVRMEFVRHLFSRFGKCPTQGWKITDTSFKKLRNDIFDWNTANTLKKAILKFKPNCVHNKIKPVCYLILFKWQLAWDQVQEYHQPPELAQSQGNNRVKLQLNTKFKLRMQN